MVKPWLDDAFWAGTRRPLHAATGLDPAAYADDGFFADERERVFGRAWVCIGVAAEAVDPGRLLVRDVGEVSVIVTRDMDGRLYAFRNSCRHRGTELASEDCDIAGTIRCPYHRWGYALDGTLVSTPLFDEVPRDGFDPTDHALVPVRVDTWGTLLFACLDAGTPPLDEWLGDLSERMAGYRFDTWLLEAERRLDIAANWKLIAENFAEYYHLTWVHPELAKVSRVKDHYRYQGPGMYLGQTTTPVSGDDRDDWLVLPSAEGLDGSDAASGRFVAIFPNVLLAVLPGHIFLIRLEPRAPGRTIEWCSLLVPAVAERVDEETVSTTLAFWFDINDEDIDIVERAQRGIARGAAPAGPLAPRFEEPLHRFHNMLADLMTGSGPVRDMLTIPAGDPPTAEARLGTAANPNPPSVEQEATGR